MSWLKNTILIIALVFTVSYREVQTLIDRGSWKAIDHLNIFWYTAWDSAWKLWDSFHVSNGIATMIMCYIISEYMINFKIKFLGKFQTAVLTILIWVAWMQVRNLFMNVL